MNREAESLEEAAEVLARKCRGVTVSGDVAVDPWQVSALAREWLKLTEDDRWRKKNAPPPPRRSWLSRLFGRRVDG